MPSYTWLFLFLIIWSRNNNTLSSTPPITPPFPHHNVKQLTPPILVKYFSRQTLFKIPNSVFFSFRIRKYCLLRNLLLLNFVLAVGVVDFFAVFVVEIKKFHIYQNIHYNNNDNKKTTRNNNMSNKNNTTTEIATK